jgi:hypothetical protein
MPNAAQMHQITAKQSRLAELKRGLEKAEKFLDKKAYVMDESGKPTLMSSQEITEEYAKIEREIGRLGQQD